VAGKMAGEERFLKRKKRRGEGELLYS